MTYLAHPVTTPKNASQHVPSSGRARRQTGRPGATQANRPNCLPTGEGSYLVPIGRRGAQTHQLATARGDNPEQASIDELTRERVTKPAKAKQDPTFSRRVEEHYDTTCQAPTNQPGRTTIRPVATDIPTTGAETQRQERDAKCTQDRLPDGSGKRNLPHSNSSEVDIIWTPYLGSAIGNLTSPPHTPLALTGPPRRERPHHTTSTSAGLLTRPSFVPRGHISRSAASASCGLLDASVNPYEAKFRLIKVGIETEFFLAAPNPGLNHTTLEGFVAKLTQRHNEQVPRPHPRMLETLRPYNYTGPYTKWSLLQDSSLGSTSVPCKIIPT
jgi:hypothetical protein